MSSRVKTSLLSELSSMDPIANQPDQPVHPQDSKGKFATKFPQEIRDWCIRLAQIAPVAQVEEITGVKRQTVRFWINNDQETVRRAKVFVDSQFGTLFRQVIAKAIDGLIDRLDSDDTKVSEITGALKVCFEAQRLTDGQTTDNLGFTGDPKVAMLKALAEIKAEEEANDKAKSTN